MKEIILSLAAGFLIGVVFKAVNLPSPAPPVFGGVLGIVGVYLGSKTMGWISTYIL